MSKHVVVGYDGSKTSDEAARWAAAEAIARGADLGVVTCYSLPVAGDAVAGVWMAGESVVTVAQAAAEMSQSIRDELAVEFPDLRVTTRVSSGPAGGVLIDGLGGDDLVVVGASAHGELMSKLLGSTARWVARHSPCPVVVVRGAATRGRPDRVVVGVDGSAASASAITWAADEADRHGVELVVVHAWVYAYFGTDGYSSTARDLTRVDAALVLDRAVEIARERCAARVTGVLIEDTPTDGLLEHVRDGDLLVVGSRGRGAIRSGLFGSTANSVVENAAIPVAIVRGCERGATSLRA